MSRIPKRLGVIGGMGPLATAYFYELLTTLNSVQKEQEHVETIIYSCPAIPDRTSYILRESNESPVSLMIGLGRKLASVGADFIAIPCVTAHYFHKELSEGIPVPVINVLSEMSLHLKRKGIKSAGLMATSGTVRSQIVQNALAGNGINTVVPTPDNQRIMMDIIYRQMKVKGKADMEQFFEVSQSLSEQGVTKQLH